MGGGAGQGGVVSDVSSLPLATGGGRWWMARRWRIDGRHLLAARERTSLLQMCLCKEFPVSDSREWGVKSKPLSRAL
jgi:hypothetical protein